MFGGMNMQAANQAQMIQPVTAPGQEM